jgi:hypothetical protein
MILNQTRFSARQQHVKDSGNKAENSTRPEAQPRDIVDSDTVEARSIGWCSGGNQCRFSEFQVMHVASELIP